MAGEISKPLAAVGAVLLAFALAGCGGNASGPGSQSAVDDTTRAVYNDDVANVPAHFDDALKNQVSRSEVGILSDRMHRAGDYKGLTFVGSDPGKNEYTYRADFSSGSMNVVVRMDPDGKFSAYRVLASK